MFARVIGTSIGKSLASITRLKGGSGQALPGWIIERLLPSYYADMLSQLPEGVIVVTGTNGKTTTTKMVVELLEANGKRVLTNPTGSNLTRGINSTLIHHAGFWGTLPYDIAVLELDEAYARHFVRKVAPKWVLALNVTRDQLDRFGEVDTAARMIGDTMRFATAGIVTNANDPRLLKLAEALVSDTRQLTLFGVDERLRHYFPSENELVAVGDTVSEVSDKPAVNVSLSQFSDREVSYTFTSGEYTTKLQLTGQHNYQNAAAALALTQALLPAIDPQTLVQQLAQVRPAFGRGEVYNLKNSTTLRIVLVKNPAGFRQSLASYLPHDGPVMITINDNIADGRDVSWLWDVDFTQLKDHHVAFTSGTRAYDMATRLQYEDIVTHNVQPNIVKALEQFSALEGDKLLFTTYTAMLKFYVILQKEAGVTNE